MNYYDIGQKIRKMRKARGLSQEALAECVGISVTHMSHIETANTKLSLPVLAALADALETGTDELLCRDADSARATAESAITRLLGSCTAGQLRVMESILKAAKTSMDQYM